MLTPKTPAVMANQPQGRDKSEVVAAGGHRKKERSASHQVCTSFFFNRIMKLYNVHAEFGASNTKMYQQVTVF